MKVTTDACLFGAFSADKKLPAKAVLDIGGGTGLLTLMLAQKMPAQLYTIEKDDDAFRQMEQNVDVSPWKERIHIIHGDILEYDFEQRFDFVITNPPFYENELRSPDTRKNMAMHDVTLTLEKLVVILEELVSESGSFGILLPYFRSAAFINLAADHGFYLQEHLQVRQTTRHGFFRSMLLFSRVPSETVVQELSIKDENGNYHEAFRHLLKDYYLYL